MVIQTNGYSYHAVIELGDARIRISIQKAFDDISEEKDLVCPVHSHSGFEVHMVSDGEGILESEHGNLFLNSGDILILPPGLIHRRLSLSEGVKTAFSFIIEENTVESSDGTYTYVKDVLSLLTEPKTLVCAHKYSEYFDKIFAHYNENAFFSPQRLDALFRLLITDLISDIDILFGRKYDGKSRILNDNYALVASLMEEYITGYYNKSPSLSELSRRVHLGKRQATRVFSRCFGVSFSEYVKRRRLESAKYLLSNTDKPFVAIAMESGYKSYNGFYKLFKSSMGISPEEYRKKQQNQKAR